MGKRYDLGVQRGDLFAAPLPDGRFGAVHVIEVTPDGMRRGRDSATLVTTRYLGRTPPSIDDPSLREVLRERRFSFRGTPAVMIVDQPPPADFVRVGTFPPTSEEAAIDPRGTYGAGWGVVSSVLLEWRWEHDRQGFVHEVEQERRRASASPASPPTARRRTPRSTLTDGGFWKLIACVDLGRDDDDEVLEPLIAALARRSAADIREFHELLAHKLYLLDAARFADHAGAAGASDDGFLYARCAVVARGKKFFDAVLARPARFPPEGDLEGLLQAAPEAYLRRTGRDYEEDTHYSYETGSNVEGWPSG